MYPPAAAPPAAPPPAPAPMLPPVLTNIGTAGWRLIVAACAFYGVFLVAYDPVLGWSDLWFLSQSGSLVAAILYGLMAPIPLIPGGEKAEPVVAWVRGALASMMMLICIASIFILGEGDLGETGFLFEHLLTPLIVAADFVLVGRFSARTRAWHPVTWIGFPLLYLILANLAGEAPMLYGGILDPGNSEFLMYTGMFLVTAIVFGYILFGLAKLRGFVASSIAGATPVAPQPMPGQFAVAGHPQPGMAYGQPAPGYPQPNAGYQQPQANAGYPPPVSGGYGQPPAQPPTRPPGS
ncbi:hypothetical protein [Stackebrandtia nassauensis]|uniref:Uncharacterized protein n=1 Tax=Stackebrandtia nassauensis (strain DSM 44728 / CIP 108903 / NRRL B-16338 / NBRC 102104 / LLR-40K-21) TaxID=446470 RepID=D3PX17_STANL|nr:hypothetical protein [Stackebrandtia nassauensis]ADD45241.1 hypothetical protein Snas_5611 [Stackebrandtia nassauensis DSM 44728]